MLRTNIARATTVVGVGMKDLRGSKSAMRKALTFAKPGDRIFSLHVPKVVPEMMLSSMNDPSDEDALDMLTTRPSKAGEALQSEMRQEVEAALALGGKSVEVVYKTVPPSSDVKTLLLNYCRMEKAGTLFVGPGQDYNGTMPTFLATHAKGFTVCVVRDNAE